MTRTLVVDEADRGEDLRLCLRRHLLVFIFRFRHDRLLAGHGSFVKVFFQAPHRGSVRDASDADYAPVNGSVIPLQIGG